MNLTQRIAQLQSLIALAVLMIALSVSTDSFLTPENGMNVLRQISVNLCLSIGMTLVIVSGGIDLSVGSVLAFSAAVSAWLLKYGVDLAPLGVHVEFTVAGTIVAGVLVGSLLGLVNGLLVARLGMPAFIVTLGMLSIARGLTELWTGGHPITGLGDDFGWLGTGDLHGVPVPAMIVAGLVAVFTVVTLRTRFGRHLYAVGGAERAARLSGVNVARVKTWAYICSGALSGMAGLLLTARLDSATPRLGETYELDSIAAVVIGGASLSGGRGSVLGAVLGCLIIGVLNNGLALLDVSPFWQKVIKGVVILLAVAIDRLSRRQTA
ncbi:Ribose transport system permease protein RbsC [Posidoniimonas polymericola]|uniref:Ribose transport system permease protein RbsC n=1 Tax=Posidoniimonas polymericola TaxID=2528002 RepID=A0A5C5ZFY1_9BACT|nr:ABC transporter permease [Posidoniimonas polymericola]TWT86005.1 Ribose transport system permease protein RbsC [Posidoniimonas polymericola]